MKLGKKRRFLSIFVFMSILFIGMEVEAGTTINLAKNPSFEDGFNGWDQITNYPNDYYLDSVEKLFGDTSLKMETYNHDRGYYHSSGGVTHYDKEVGYYIAVKPNTTYTISYYIKTDRPDRVWALPNTWEEDGNGHELGQHYSYIGLSSTQEWQRVSYTFTTFPTSVKMKFAARIHATYSTTVDGWKEGDFYTTWIDGIQLEEGETASNFHETKINAGEDLVVSQIGQNSVIIQGNAADSDNIPLMYRWLEGSNELSSWQNVGLSGEAYLDLSTLLLFTLGKHTLVLEITDGQSITYASDQVILGIYDTTVNLVTNSGFEDGFAGWDQNTSYPNDYYLDAVDKMFGNTSLKIETYSHPNGYYHSYGGVSQYWVEVKPNTTYTISYYIKTNNPVKVWAFPSTWEYDTENNGLGQHYRYISLAPTQEWQRISYTFTTFPTTAKMKFAAQIYAVFTTDVGIWKSGEFYTTRIDGIQLEERDFATPYLDTSNTIPVASAGENLTISSDQQNATIVLGTASDSDNDPLTYRWLEGSNELSPWQNVGSNGEAHLFLSTLPPFSIRQHTLILEVSDGQTTSSDDMILTVGNSAPNVAPTGGGVYEIFSTITLGGQVSDYDGNTLTCEWLEGDAVLFTDIVPTIPGGNPVALPEHTLSYAALGTHTLTLKVNDGINSPVTGDITIKIIDATAPTLAPAPNLSIIWPPNHTMVNITIEANASDNLGGSVILSATVACNEPESGLWDGDVGPDWTVPVIDQNTGIITLLLRAERDDSGSGRVYTITVTATDESDNSSSAQLEIVVPHDKGKK